MQRVAVFADVDDLRRHAEIAFNCGPTVRLGAMALADRVAEGRDIALVELHQTARTRRRPGPDPFLLAEADAWRAEDPRVRVRVASGSGAGRHGAPLGVAISAVFAVADGLCDVAVIAGHDADLAPAVEVIRGNARPDAVETASWGTDDFKIAVPVRRKEPVRHRLDRGDFDAIAAAGEAAIFSSYRVTGPASAPTSSGATHNTSPPDATPHPASSGERGVFLPDPTRVGVFIDYADTVDAGRVAFGTDASRPHVAPLILAERLAASFPRPKGKPIPNDAPKRILSLVSIHHARPRRSDRDGRVAVGARAAQWREADTRVRATLREQRIRHGRPTAQGVATAVALDALLSLERGACDVAVIVSGDADLKAALKFGNARFRGRRLETAAWWTDLHRRSIPRPPSVWQHRLDADVWHAVCCD